jgi:hypothetical protein
MEPVVIILIVLVLSILDAVGRKQRQTRGGDVDAGSAATAEAESAPDGDARASRGAARHRSGVTRPASAEDIIVPELWQEIRKLARSSGGGRSERASAPPRVEPVAAPAPEPAGAVYAVHAMHGTHPKLGRPLAERRSRLALPGDRTRRSTPEVAEVRRMLAQGPAALRRAVILDEVLGPPAAFRGDPYEPGV